MKNGWLKIGADAPALRLGAVRENERTLVLAAKRAKEAGVRILAFPELCLSGATLGDLYCQAALLSATENALAAYAKDTADLDLLSFVGLPVKVNGKLYSATAAVGGGKILGLVPKTNGDGIFSAAPEKTFAIPFAGEEVPFGTDFTYPLPENPSLVIGVSAGLDLAGGTLPTEHVPSAVSLVVNPYAAPFLVGDVGKRKALVARASGKNECAVLSVGAGSYESGTDFVYAAEHTVAVCGKVVAATEPFGETSLYATIDLDALQKEHGNVPDGASDASACETENEPCKICRSPFVPEDADARRDRCRLILEMQATGLAGRMTRAYAKTLVVGVSGGLDSTLALLVARRALEKNHADPKALVAVTMPCFGTTARTRSNAEILSEEIGATFRTVDIKNAVTVHLTDLGHPLDLYDATYENAQARERTQVLMDIANAEGGLVVGTGDLSELALGWATYNGDHMSMYGVNAGIPKTLIRHIVAYAADEAEGAGRLREAKALRDVLATPVSPELLPPKDGEIAQCTEGIVGPYELHDFFLYYLVRYGFAPSKILCMACAAFGDTYSEEVVRGWLKVFLRRFFSQQFKRSCLPDGVAIGSVGLSPRAGFRMPSDAVADAFLAELGD